MPSLTCTGRLAASKAVLTSSLPSPTLVLLFFFFPISELISVLCCLPFQVTHSHFAEEIKLSGKNPLFCCHQTRASPLSLHAAFLPLTTHRPKSSCQLLLYCPLNWVDLRALPLTFLLSRLTSSPRTPSSVPTLSLAVFPELGNPSLRWYLTDAPLILMVTSAL